MFLQSDQLLFEPSILTAPAATLDTVDGGQGHRRGRELGDGEGHGAEQLAGIPGGCGNAFLVGNDELGGVDEILSGTDQAHQREKADGHHQGAAVAVMIVVVVTAGAMFLAQRRRKAGADRRGDIAGAATTTARHVAGRLQYTDAQNDGLHHLNNGSGDGTLLVAGLRLSTEIRAVTTAAEDGHIALSPPQHNLLFNNGDTIKLLTASGTDAPLENQPDVVADGHSVKTAVELNGVDADIGPGDASVLDAHLSGVVDDLLTEIGKKDLYVFIAIPVTAGIQDAIGLNTERITRTVLSAGVSGEGRAAGKSVFTHMNKPPYSIGRKTCSLP